jgi:hypothetical protein
LQMRVCNTASNKKKLEVGSGSALDLDSQTGCNVYC